jgi:hypothetical protein
MDGPTAVTVYAQIGTGASVVRNDLMRLQRAPLQ